MGDYRVFIKRSSRKSLALEIMPDGNVLVRAPRRLPSSVIASFIKEKEDWIEAHRKKALPKGGAKPLSMEEVRALADRALAVIPPRTAYFASVMGVTYGRITIRNQKTRWGSCSARGNLNFNCLLMLVPEDIRDYVIVHELCHRKEMNHSPRFWREVEKVLPDYRDREKWLRDNGPALMARMLAGAGHQEG